MFYTILAVLASIVLIGVAIGCFIHAYMEMEEGENAFGTIASGVFFLTVVGLYYFLVGKG